MKVTSFIARDCFLLLRYKYAFHITMCVQLNIQFKWKKLSGQYQRLQYRIDHILDQIWNRIIYTTSAMRRTIRPIIVIYKRIDKTDKREGE